MIKVLIGHRGVGKTSLLKRIGFYFPNDKIFDLDEEIEKSEKQNVSDIFRSKGESFFRALEKKIFINLIQENKNCWISLGAGFDLEVIPENILKIWVRRNSDSQGRVFLNRPRLNPSVDALTEYLDLFSKRNSNYQKYFDVQYVMPEGIEEQSPFEKSILANEYSAEGATLTLHSKNLSVSKKSFNFFEIRDDLLSPQQIKNLAVEISNELIIYSSRTKELTKPLIEKFKFWDWPLEMGSQSEANIISLHHRDQNLYDAMRLLDRSTKPHQHQKLAVHIYNFAELKLAFEWQNENPKNRSLLPRSDIGRWNWFRLYMKGRQLLNYVRLDEGSSIDQPTLFEWLQTPARPIHFSAVLGSPVSHSFSPQVHAKNYSPFFAINIETQEFSEAFSFLHQLGLERAAVTSPLKEKAYSISNEVTEIAKDLESVNTLKKINNTWVGHNTDYDGLLEFSEKFKEKKITVWGGGGTLNLLKLLFPNAQYLSVRTGKDRYSHLDAQKCEVLIWAAKPRDHLPAKTILPKIILDLNYREDSRAKEFALQVGAEYISGLKMFYAQARAQHKWYQASFRPASGGINRS